MPPAPPPCPQAAPTPVFVDDTGRRHRLVRLIGWTAGGLTLAYLALLGISLIGSPGLVPLSLPAIGRVLPDSSAPQIGAPSKFVRGGPEQSTVVEQLPTPGGGTGITSGPATSNRRVAATPVARHTPTPAPSASASSPAHTPQGNPSPAGTPRATHTPAPHPSTNNGHGSPRNVKGSPTPSPT